MFSLKHTILTAAAVVLSAAIFAGCKTSKPKPQPAPPPVSSATETNQPTPPQSADSGDTMAPHILAWDSVSKEYRAKPGELSASFTFNLTNVSADPVTIYDTSTTCDCTVARLPSKPWTLPSGATGKIEASIDLHNKIGVVTNSIVVFTSQGNRRLWVKAYAPGG